MTFASFGEYHSYQVHARFLGKFISISSAPLHGKGEEDVGIPSYLSYEQDSALRLKNFFN